MFPHFEHAFGGVGLVHIHIHQSINHELPRGPHSAQSIVKGFDENPVWSGGEEEIVGSASPDAAVALSPYAALAFDRACQQTNRVSAFSNSNLPVRLCKKSLINVPPLLVDSAPLRAKVPDPSSSKLREHGVRNR